MNNEPQFTYAHVPHEAPSEHQRPMRGTREEYNDSKNYLTAESPYFGSDTTYQPNYSPSTNPPSGQPRSAPTFYSVHEHGDGDGECRAKEGYRRHHTHWASLSILLLAVYAVIMSGIWVGLAVSKPYYPFIGGPKGLPPTVASTLVAAIAKSIELAFVTVFVAFLGQFLSRKALSATSDGITLADMQLRSFMLQPGLILQSWQFFHYTALTILGILAMVAATCSLLYTTSSDALVSPKMGIRNREYKTMTGFVDTAFANNSYIGALCPTPIDANMDEDFAGSTCAAIEHSGQSYHNYMQYLTNWQTVKPPKDKDADLSLKDRPLPVGMLFDNTTAQGHWLFADDIPVVQRNGSRTINNVTLVMPHAGVYSVAVDAMPTRELGRVGKDDNSNQFMEMEARVPLPGVNVFCADVTQDEISPLVVSTWPEYKDVDTSKKFFGIIEQVAYNFRNKTSIDDLFGWSDTNPPPVFPKIPIEYNTVFNYSQELGRDTVYLLTTSNVTDFTRQGVKDVTVDGPASYNLCAMSMFMHQGCSTGLKIEVQGGEMFVLCDDKSKLPYSDNWARNDRIDKWASVAQTWGTSLSLGAGISDGAASNARLLSQLNPLSKTFAAAKPTIAEALAVMAGCTLLTSTMGAPFTQEPYAQNLDAWSPMNQTFEATLAISGYMSGSGQQWQLMFNVVLVTVFLISCFCLCYFIHIIRIDGLVNDFMEFQNMFSLALHSPADRRLAGTAAGGPETGMMRERWFIKEDREHQVFIGDGKRARGHTSWMSHAPTSPRQRGARVETRDVDFENVEGKVPQTYKPGVGDGIRRKIGGLNIFTGRKGSPTR